MKNSRTTSSDDQQHKLSMLVTRILGGLYLSSIDPILKEIDLKTEYGISHIVSVVPGAMKESYSSDYEWKQIEITDEETTNVIQYFPESYNFIDSGLFKNSNNKKHQGCVLVHCSQGISRSATFIIAFLMQKYHLSIDQALHAVRRKCPDAEPNPGFMNQLRLYREMEFKIDETNQKYNELLKNNALKADPTGRGLRNMIMDKSESPKEVKEEQAYELRCKRCRQILAGSAHIEDHDIPESDSRQASFIKTAPNSRRIISIERASLDCSHYFFKEPVKWMKQELDKSDMEGKFQCPKCSSKVGGYSWRGSRCSCGKWMVPAIHLQEAKVDYIKKENYSS